MGIVVNMRLPDIFKPKAALSQEEVSRGLHNMILECMASTGFSCITSSTFLIAFALVLGANNFQIGILASIPFITDFFQIPAVWFIEKFRCRKATVFCTWLISLLLWIPIALIPIIMQIPSGGAISLLIGLMAVRGMLNAFSNCGWSSWMRDLIPKKILGRYFARRLSLATIVSIVLGLGAAFFLQHWDEAGRGILGYSCVLLVGLVFFGLVSPVFTILIPEPAMKKIASSKPPFWQSIAMPLREKNYRQLIKFFMFWGFASSMAFPFFEVFMLSALNLPIFNVIVFATITEIFIALSLRIWGPIADRFGSKFVMSASTLLFLLVLLGWAGVATQWQGLFLIPILLILHVIEGISIAGILLAEEALSLKLAPQHHATSYMAVASLADSAGTGLGVLTGGFLADFFTLRISGRLDLSWMGPLQGITTDNMQLTGFYFLFVLSFVIGLITRRTLQCLHETGMPRRKAPQYALNTAVSTVFHKAGMVWKMNPFHSHSMICSAAVLKKYTGECFYSYYSPYTTKTLGDGMINTRHGLQKKPPPLCYVY